MDKPEDKESDEKPNKPSEAEQPSETTLHPPREGSRATRKGILVSTHPDFHRLPDGSIIPYISVAFQDEDVNTATTVRMTGKRAHTMNSRILRCHGAPLGMGVGVKSGTSGSVCQPITHSKTVRIEGHFAVRHGDLWSMNNGNTVGKMNWVVEPWEGASEEEKKSALAKMANAGKSGENARAAVAASAAGIAAGTSLPPRPERWPATPSQTSPSSSTNLWGNAGNLAKKGVGVRALPLVGGFIDPDSVGDGTLTGALRREADSIAQQTQALQEKGASLEEVAAFHAQAWEALYESRPELFQEAIWGEVFPEIATTKADNKKQERERDLGITEDNVRITRPTEQHKESAEKEQEEKLKELEKEAGVEQKTKGKTKHGEKSGGMTQAEKDFDSLKPKNPTTQEILGKGKITTGKLRDGRDINVRDFSSDGRPTIEIRDNDGNGRGIEIRYNP